MKKRLKQNKVNIQKVVSKQSQQILKKLLNKYKLKKILLLKEKKH
jgi:hypothetical protein